MNYITNPEIENELQSILSKDEQLIWTGRPRQGVFFRGSDIFMIPFSCMWCGFAIFWESMATGHGAPFFSTLWGIPFILVGLYMTIGRFFVDAQMRQKTMYGVTHSRVIIKSGLFNSEIQSLYSKALPEIRIGQNKDGSGTISFGANDYRSVMTQGLIWPGVKQQPKLDHIDNAQEVYNLIAEGQRG